MVTRKFKSPCGCHCNCIGFQSDADTLRTHCWECGMNGPIIEIDPNEPFAMLRDDALRAWLGRRLETLR